MLTLRASQGSAHDPFEITTLARLEPAELHLEVTMTRPSALALLAGRHDLRASFSRAAFPEYQARFAALAGSLYLVKVDGVPLASRAAAARLSPEDEVVFDVQHDLPRGGTLELVAVHLSLLPSGYVSSVHLLGGASQTSLGMSVLDQARPVLRHELAQPGNAAPTASPQPFHKLLALGAEHILTGYDHLCFLAGVLVACRGLRDMLALVTAFTAAHSLTLALAVLGHLRVPSAMVEPLIATSILFVGVENLLPIAGTPARRAHVCVWTLAWARFCWRASRPPPGRSGPPRRAAHV